MDQDEQELIQQLRLEFFHTTEDDLLQCEQCILKFEVDRSIAHIQTLKRLIHSLKGSAKAIDFYALADRLHHFESELDLDLASNDHKKLVNAALKQIDNFRAQIELLKTSAT